MTTFKDATLARLRAQPPQRRLSEVLSALAAEAQGPVTVERIRDALGDRSFATLLVFFSAINLLPLPPGSSAILGLPILFVAAQMVFGSERVWLPAFILRKSLSLDQFRAVITRLTPWLARLERFVKPRYWPFSGRQDERLIGAVALVMAVSVVLPIPLGNWLPAFAATLLGLSLSERDAVVFVAGLACAVASLVVIALVIGSAGALVGWFWTHPPLDLW